MKEILHIVGARPNFMKIGPVMRALSPVQGVHQTLIHTGQHYDSKLSEVFFSELGIPAPEFNLSIGSRPRLEQIELLDAECTRLFAERRPDLVVVVGDVNSTVAAARAASRLGISLAHIESGLRSNDDSMPEELNRVETDQLSDYLFVTEESGMRNLGREGVQGKAFLVGNVMIDTLVHARSAISQRPVLERFGLSAGEYAVSTFHRPSNVDSIESLRGVLSVLRSTAAQIKVLFPLHPRTEHALKSHDLYGQLEEMEGVQLCPPLGYLDFIAALMFSRLAITDSGGIQEETTYLKVPCITMRENTERPITAEIGSNVLAGTSPEKVRAAIRRVLSAEPGKSQIPPLWDGKAALRIVDILCRELLLR